MRPAEVDHLIGDASKGRARARMGALGDIRAVGRHDGRRRPRQAAARGARRRRTINRRRLGTEGEDTEDAGPDRHHRSRLCRAAARRGVRESGLRSDRLRRGRRRKSLDQQGTAATSATSPARTSSSRRQGGQAVGDRRHVEAPATWTRSTSACRRRSARRATPICPT